MKEMVRENERDVEAKQKEMKNDSERKRWWGKTMVKMKGNEEEDGEGNERDDGRNERKNFVLRKRWWRKMKWNEKNWKWW